MQQKLVQNLFTKKAGAFGSNLEKEPQKPRSKYKKMCIVYLLRIFALPAIQCKW